MARRQGIELNTDNIHMLYVQAMISNTGTPYLWGLISQRMAHNETKKPWLTLNSMFILSGI